MRRGRYVARLACDPQDIAAARALRGLCFLGGARPDSDAFDASCDHLLVEEADSGTLVSCFRLRLWSDGTGIGQSYAAQFYDLRRLEGFGKPVLELGRFCVRPGCTDPDILRLGWAAMTRCVDARGVGLLFGCASFAGTQPARYAQAFELLGARHLAPGRWRPGVRAPEVVRFGTGPASAADLRGGLAALPPLLRTYLGMGGWVSDHAVIDRAMNTLHVFTGVEIAAIPAARKRALRALACSAAAPGQTAPAKPA